MMNFKQFGQWKIRQKMQEMNEDTVPDFRKSKVLMSF